MSTICCHTSNNTLGCIPLSLVTSWRDRARGRRGEQRGERRGGEGGGEGRGGEHRGRQGEVPDVHNLYCKYIRTHATRTTTRIHTYTPDVVAAQRTHGLHHPQKSESRNKHTHRQTDRHITHTHTHIHFGIRTYCSGSIQTDHKCSMLRMHSAHTHTHTPLHAGRTTSIMSRTLFCSSFSKSRPLT